MLSLPVGDLAEHLLMMMSAPSQMDPKLASVLVDLSFMSSQPLLKPSKYATYVVAPPD